MSENGELRLSIHALVVETPSCRIIVDTCFGNDKQRENERSNMLCGSFLRDLEAAGFPASSFDYALCTHLHVDHVGWNTVLVDGKWEVRLKTHATSWPVANTNTGLGIGKSSNWGLYG